MTFFTPRYPKSFQIGNFYENLKISEDLVKSGEIFIKFGAKDDEFKLKIGKFCEF